MLVVCNGAKRSGSTLQFNITRSLLELTGKGEGGGFYAPGQLSEADVDLMMRQGDWIAIKAHHLEPAILSAAAQSSKCLIFHTYRDLRDVAVSAQRFWKLSWEDTLTLLRQSVVLSDALEGHPHTLAQRYEALISQTPLAVEEIATHLEIPLTDTLVDNVWEASNAESADKAIASIPLRQRALARTHLMWKGVPQPIRQALRETGLGSHVLRRFARNVVEPTTHLHPRHISSSLGMPGAWRDVLTAAQISDIESMFGDWLVARNYELSAG